MSRTLGFAVSICVGLTLAGGAVWLLRTDSPARSVPARPGARLPGAPVAPPGSAVIAEQSASAELGSVAPVTIHLADVVVTTENPDSSFNRWLRGELESGNEESIISAAEMAALREASRRLPPDPTVLDPLRAPAVAPTVGFGFAGIDYTEGGGSVPPDPAIAVGSDHIITAVNAAFEIFDTTGASVFGPTTGGSLFAGLPFCSTGLYDPDVLYDEETGRYVIAYDKGAFSSNGGYCVAVTGSSDPLGAWNLYFISTNSSGAWLDYPHAGIADEYLAFGGNMFDMDGAFVEARIWALPKAALYDGATATVHQRSLGSNQDSPHPLHLHGALTGGWPQHGHDVYVLSEPYDGRHYTLHRWSVDSDSLTTIGSADLGQAGYPIETVQNGAGTLQANDWRPQGFEYRDGHGWTATTVACNPGNGTVNCVRWAQIDLATAELGPAGSGVLGADGVFRSFPALAVNACGDMVVGYTRSSSAEYPGIFASGRLAGDPAGALGGELELKAGEISYTAFDGSPHRWGDYTGMAVDPDGVTFWYLGEYSKVTGTTNGRWATWISQLSYASCESPLVFYDGFESGSAGAWSSAAP